MRAVGIARVAIGLVQGVVLYVLWWAAHDSGKLLQSPALLAAALLVVAYVPLVGLIGAGSLRLPTLLAWVGVAAAALAGLAIHDVHQQAEGPGSPWPSFALWAFVAVGLFIAHHLIAAADVERRVVASYPRYFEIAWKNGVQIALSALFVGLFWLVLWLGAALFGAIGIGGFATFIAKPIFAIPATTVMTAAAVHLTDVRAGLIRGIRTVVLTLLAWLAPILAGLATAFLLALPFTGLEPLWRTRSAAASLLGAAAALIILVNAAYQDGQPDDQPPAILRWSARLAAILLLPLVGLAAYAVWLRVDQYGLTPERVAGVACVVVGACYAIGYAIAALRLAPWLKALEPTNIATGVISIAVILALFTPLADPVRLSVADQLRRLDAGEVSAADFDYDFLRFRSGRYGRDALAQLVAQGGPAGENAARTKDKSNEWSLPPRPVITADQRRANIMVWPQGRQLPESFLNQDWNRASAAADCLTENKACDAFLADLTGDGREEVLIRSSFYVIQVYRENGGQWAYIGRLPLDNCGETILEPLRKGRFVAVPSPFMDIDVGGIKLRLDTTVATTQRPECTAR